MAEKINMPRKRENDWATKSEKALRACYGYRVRAGLEIEPELNAELARRFPNYEPVSQKFTGKKRKKTPMQKDWTKSSAKSLREIYRYRVRNGIEISLELNDELARRFPTYDPAAQKFIGTKRKSCSTKPKSAPAVATSEKSVKKTRHVITDWTKSSDESLRVTYRRHIHSARGLEPELNDELARRFPTYDPVTQKFMGRKKKIGPSKKIRNQTDWSKSSDGCLRTVHSKRIKTGREIEPELNAELVRRFPGYDPITQKFTGTQNKAHHTTISFSKAVKASLRSRYRYYCQKGVPINPDLNAQLANAFSNYDPVRQVFVQIKKPKTNFSEMSDVELRYHHNNRKRSGREIEPQLNEELARRFPGYRPDIQEFTGKHKRYRVVTQAGTTKPFELCATSTLRNLYRGYTDKKDIPDDLNEELCRRYANYDKATRTFTEKRAILRKEPLTANEIVDDIAPVKVGAPVAVAPVKGFPLYRATEFMVDVKPVAETADGMYNDVYINGRRILQNHLNTEVRVFGDGILLGIRGTVTTDENYPSARSVWLLYDTDGNVNRWAGDEKWSGYKVYIKTLQDIPSAGMLRAAFSDTATRIIDLAREQRRAMGKVFQIVTEKTK